MTIYYQLYITCYLEQLSICVFIFHLSFKQTQTLAHCQYYTLLASTIHYYYHYLAVMVDRTKLIDFIQIIMKDKLFKYNFLTSGFLNFTQYILTMTYVVMQCLEIPCMFQNQQLLKKFNVCISCIFS